MEENKSMVKFVNNMIDTAEWTHDCNGKQDLDFPILQASTRYYPDYTAFVGFIVSDKDGDYRYVLKNDEMIVGMSEEDCKQQCKQWYKDHYKNALLNLYLRN